MVPASARLVPACARAPGVIAFVVVACAVIVRAAFAFDVAFAFKLCVADAPLLLLVFPFAVAVACEFVSGFFNGDAVAFAFCACLDLALLSQFQLRRITIQLSYAMRHIPMIAEA